MARRRSRALPDAGRAARRAAGHAEPTTCAAATSRSTRWRSRSSGDELGHLHDPDDGRRDLEPRRARPARPQLPRRPDAALPRRPLRGPARLPDGRADGGPRARRDRIGAMETVSGTRVREELLAMLRRARRADGLKRMHELGLLDALSSGARARHRARRRRPRSAPSRPGADRVLAVLAAIVCPEPDAAGREPRPGRATSATGAPRRPRRAAAGRGSGAELSPSGIHTLLRDEPPEALALALASARRPRRSSSGRRLRHVRLEIRGGRPDRRGRRAARARPGAGRDAACQARRRGRGPRRRAGLRAEGAR